MTSLIKPNDSWGHNFPKNIYMGFSGHLLYPSLDKGTMECVSHVQQPETVSRPCDVEVRPPTQAAATASRGGSGAREAKACVFQGHNPLCMGEW